MIRRDNNKKLVEKNLDLIFEFEKYILQYPRFARKIPDGSVVVLQVKGDEQFNRWSQRLAKKQAKKGQGLFYVTITSLGPVRSRIKKLEIEDAA